MSLSPFESFQSRFVSYLLNRPRIKLTEIFFFLHTLKTYGGV